MSLMFSMIDDPIEEDMKWEVKKVSHTVLKHPTFYSIGSSLSVQIFLRVTSYLKAPPTQLLYLSLFFSLSLSLSTPHSL